MPPLRGKVRIGGRTLVVRVIVHFTQTLATLSLPLKPRFSISARSEADQEVEDVREKAKIVQKA